ncbi:hypothetical protein FLAG1_11297 [Fusarium langsethiae]|uniref:BZIP domain-containing protein n=1 Tax=Fusarium langsethiae TaxID=179993 RepID=A0A0M9EMZ8_FUSLA|nr:hypothetical protein FLAG1_11297 [Fusarium langsethiae]
MIPLSTTGSNSQAPSSVDDGGDQALGPRRGRRPLEIPVVGSVSNRRRMQNRMAQRAYRQRKESAIDILKKKVEELEKVKEDIGNEFVNFTTVILEQDSVRNCPDIVEHIKKSTINILTSTREVDETSETEDEDMDQVASTNGEPVLASQDHTLSVDHVSSLGFPIVDFVPQLEFDNLLDQDTNTEPTIPHYDYNFTPPPAFDKGSYFQLPISHTPDYNMYQLPGANYDTSMPCPRSYSSQEATFGRRYHRAAQEAGFLLASMKHSPPSWYKTVFGFCMHFETREEICQRLGDSVRKSRKDTLNNWKSPFTNVGGAGSFYPNHGYSSSELPIGNRSGQSEAYRPSEMSGFSMGPFGPSIEQVRDLRLNPQLRIIDPNYDGDFFDADEMEICLRGYGVTIPANKDFVTAYIDMAMFERAEAREKASSQADDPATPPDISTDTGHLFEVPSLQCETEATSLHCPVGLMGMAMGAMPPYPKPQPQHQWKTPTRRETKVKVDVERLITCKVNKSLMSFR